MFASKIRRTFRASSFLAMVALTLACHLSAEELSPVKVGATLMLTGYGAKWGQNAQQGIELALSKVNSEGGINGRPMRVLYEDYGELDLKRAASAAQKLISADKVAVLLTLIIEDSEVVCPIAERHGLLTVTTGAGSRESSELCSSLFRTTSSDEELVSRGISYALEMGKSRACVLASQIRYYESFASFTVEEWKKRTGFTPLVISVPWGVNDYRSLLIKLKNADCDVVYLQTGIPAEGMILRQARDLGINALFIGPPTTDDPGVLSVAGHAADGVIFAKFRTGTSDFVKEYRQRYGEPPNRPAATAYDAIQLLAKAFREEGTSTSAIRKALLSTQNFSGASGPVTITSLQKRSGEIADLMIIEDGVAQPLSQNN